MSYTFLEAMKKATGYDEPLSIDAIILSDEEIVFTLNQYLEKKEQISSRTFANWKARAKSMEDNEIDERFNSFLHILKASLLKQKKYLFRQMLIGEVYWQRWAWIIERKFDEWNLKSKVESKVNVSISEKEEKEIANAFSEMDK